MFTDTIKIYHKTKGADNKMHQILLYQGACRVQGVHAMREMEGGAENSSEIRVMIRGRLTTKPSCGDFCLLNNTQKHVVKKWSETPKGYLSGAYTYLTLR